MSRLILANPKLIINRVTYEYVPGTLEYDPGFGEQDVKVFTTGSGRVGTHYAQNLEMNFSEVKATIYNVDDAERLVRDLKNNANNNTVLLSENQVQKLFTLAFNNMALVNKVNFTTGTDGKAELVFRGDPAI